MSNEVIRKPVQDARQKYSELITNALDEGTQELTNKNYAACLNKFELAYSFMFPYLLTKDQQKISILIRVIDRRVRSYPVTHYHYHKVPDYKTYHELMGLLQLLNQSGKHLLLPSVSEEDTGTVVFNSGDFV